MKIETFSAEETYALGKKLGSEAKPGDVLTLIGDLGVGKRYLPRDLQMDSGLQNPSAARPLPLCRCMRKEDFRFIILMYIGLVISRRWMRSVMRIISMAAVSP